MGVWLYMGTPSIHNMLGLSQAMHVHVSGKHVLGSACVKEKSIHESEVTSVFLLYVSCVYE